jgi:hypothetical protein
MKIADLRVQLATKVRFITNLKIAKALGLTALGDCSRLVPVR